MDSVSYLLGLMTVPCLLGIHVLLIHFKIDLKHELINLLNKKKDNI